MSRAPSLPRSEPEAQGVDSRAVLDFLRAADAGIDGLHGFMLLRHGAVVAEGAWKPFRLDEPRMLYSLSKSFASTAVGLAVSEGRLSIDDAVLSFFPGKAPRAVSPNLAAMKVRHLLSMSTGHDADTTERIMRTRDPVRAFLALPVEREPGSKFVYNSGASFMLSAIVQRLAGKRLSSYLGPRLFDRIGIEGARWDRHPCGIDFGGWGLEVKVEDIARFGQLYLREGAWEGARVLPEAWVAEATAKHSDNADPMSPNPDSDWQQGYGFQFWRCRRGSYRGDGAFGQLCVVMPEQDAVLAVVAGLQDMQAELDLAWDRLLPGFGPGPRAPAPAAARELRAFAAGLSLRPPRPAEGAGGAAVGGKTYRFGKNWAGFEAVGFGFEPEALAFRYRIARRQATGNGLDGPLALPRGSGTRTLQVGYGEWIDGLSRLDGEGPKKAAASGAWIAPDVFAMKVAALKSPTVMTIVFRFSGDSVRVEVSLNVSMGPKEFPPIEGRAD